MLNPPTFDALIVGAGPAGSHTALRLARAGHRVGLLDARSFPRAKPCGEFLSPACLPMLQELELLDPLIDAGAAQVRGMHIASPAHQTQGDYSPLGGYASSHGHGLGVRREVLDTLAVEAAGKHPGIRLLLGWRAEQPLRAEDGRVCGLTARDPEGHSAPLRARFLIAADGLHSRIARELGWSRPASTPPRFAIVARFDEVPERQMAGLHVLGRDYFAACPIDGGSYTANLVVDRAQMRGGQHGLRALFQERLQEAPVLARVLGDRKPSEALLACGPLRSRTRRTTGPGAALVGDACGFVDPMTGEGLYYAMRGAALLAPAVDCALRAPTQEARALRRYVRARRLEFGPRYALARLLQRGLRQPGLPDRVVGMLQRSPRVQALLLGLTGDYLPPSALLRPSVWRAAGQPST
ncbi:MAG: hypothetical protein CMJ94_08855 [Planctomycetes bacterium]|nr:hypothetical protein [Planctomycetota bacterium]